MQPLESMRKPMERHTIRLHRLLGKKGDAYECDLVLRNNRTSEDRPLGIFHPNPSLHHIKKENIGLIEVMGLAVLPARLAVELDVLKKSNVTARRFNSQSADGFSCCLGSRSVRNNIRNSAKKMQKQFCRQKSGKFLNKCSVMLAYSNGMKPEKQHS